MSVSVPGQAFARAAGMPTESCSCHSGGATPTVLITPDLMNVNPGQMVNLTVSVSATNGKTAGFFLEASTGKLSVVDSGTRLDGDGIVQNAARTGTGNAITFKVGWTAPAAPGGVDFRVWANSANGKGDMSGDGEGTGFYSLAFGCTGNKYYLDGDADGVGSESAYTMACSQPSNYSEKTGDCADNDPRVFPGNPEVCDGRDNNCDGKVDEGLELATLCADADSDGHGVSGKGTIVGCNGDKGFGLCDNDCNDADATVFPGAPEICNKKDDNCNNQVDESARPTCGVGWCKRVATDCSTACMPGPPRVETCNNFDDDCDGVNDNGTDLELCGAAGLACRSGFCVAADGSGGSLSNAGSSASGGASSGGVTSSGGTLSNGGTPPTNGGSAGETRPEAQPTGGCSLGRGVPTSPLAAGALLVSGALLCRQRRRLRVTRR